MDKDSRQVLEIRRNWREDDPNCLAKKTFVKYPFVPVFGFYEIGLLQISRQRGAGTDRRVAAGLGLGNVRQLPWLPLRRHGRTAADERFPASRPAAASRSTRAATCRSSQADHAAPVQGSRARSHGALIQEIRGHRPARRRHGRNAGRRRQAGDAPVGTTLALIEQATKVLAAVHVSAARRAIRRIPAR